MTTGTWVGSRSWGSGFGGDARHCTGAPETVRAGHYRGAVLPDWLDVDTLRWLIPVIIIVVLVVMVLIARFVTKMVTKVILLVILAIFGVSLWAQRADLGDCADTCKCRLYGQEVEIPADGNPRCQQPG